MTSKLQCALCLYDGIEKHSDYPICLLCVNGSKFKLRNALLEEEEEKKENMIKGTDREKILNKAVECVCGHREQDYGSPENNFQIIANLWNDYINDDRKNGVKLTAKDVAMMMALLKIARARGEKPTEDTFVDLAGYAACGGELSLLGNECDFKKGE